MLTEQDINLLKKTAQNMRRNILKMIHAAKSGEHSRCRKERFFRGRRFEGCDLLQGSIPRYRGLRKNLGSVNSVLF